MNKKETQALSDLYGVPASRIRDRLKAGKTLDEAISKEIVRYRPTRSITVNGEVFESLKAVSKAFGIDYYVLQKRLQKGASPEEAVKTTVVPKQKRKPMLEIDGVSYPSLKAAIAAHGLVYETVYKRVLRDKKKKGYEAAVYDAFHQEGYKTFGCQGSKAIPVTVEKKEFPSLHCASDFFKVEPVGAWEKFVSGKSPEEAFKRCTKQKFRKRKPIVIDRIAFPSIRAAAEAFGANYQAVARLIRNGVKPEAAFKKLKQ